MRSKCRLVCRWSLVALAIQLFATVSAAFETEEEIDKINARMSAAAGIKQQSGDQETELKRARDLLKDIRKNLSGQLKDAPGVADFEKQLETARKAREQARKSLRGLYQPQTPALKTLLALGKSANYSNKAARELGKLMELTARRALAHDTQKIQRLQASIKRRDSQIKDYQTRLKRNLDYQASIDQVTNEDWKDILLQFLEKVREHEREIKRQNEIRRTEFETHIPEYSEEAAAANRRRDMEWRAALRRRAIDRLRTRIEGGGGSLSINYDFDGVTYQIGGSTFEGGKPGTGCFLMALCSQSEGQ